MNQTLANLTVASRQRASYPRDLVEAIRLRDGTHAKIRPICRGDLLRERAFFLGLSSETRYQRLMSARKLMPGELRRLTDIDYGQEMALVAVAVADGVERIRGVARYVRDDVHEPGSAEFAIVIDDRWQGQGLGEVLLERLARAARDRDVAVLTGITLSSNHRMIAVARKLGFRRSHQAHDATVTELRLEIQGSPAARGRCAVETLQP